MMLCIDGTEIETLVLALLKREGDAFVAQSQETLARRLGNELAVIEEFLFVQHVALVDVEAFGVVRGPGSAGALRSVLSLIDAWAIAGEKDVFSATRDADRWVLEDRAKPYVLPVYDRAPHTTASSKDALLRKL